MAEETWFTVDPRIQILPVGETVGVVWYPGESLDGPGHLVYPNRGPRTSDPGDECDQACCR